MITFLCLIVEDPFNEGESKISELKNVHGNGLHLGGRLIEILHLDAETEPQRLADSKIKGIENRIIFLKIDLKWAKIDEDVAKNQEKLMTGSMRIFLYKLSDRQTDKHGGYVKWVQNCLS